MFALFFRLLLADCASQNPVTASRNRCHAIARHEVQGCFASRAI